MIKITHQEVVHADPNRRNWRLDFELDDAAAIREQEDLEVELHETAVIREQDRTEMESRKAPGRVALSGSVHPELEEEIEWLGQYDSIPVGKSFWSAFRQKPSNAEELTWQDILDIADMEAIYPHVPEPTTKGKTDIPCSFTDNQASEPITPVEMVEITYRGLGNGDLLAPQFGGVQDGKELNLGADNIHMPLSAQAWPSYDGIVDTGAQPSFERDSFRDQSHVQDLDFIL